MSKHITDSCMKSAQQLRERKALAAFMTAAKEGDQAAKVKIADVAQVVMPSFDQWCCLEAFATVQLPDAF